jgi:hypothetical protein
MPIRSEEVFVVLIILAGLMIAMISPVGFCDPVLYVVYAAASFYLARWRVIRPFARAFFAAIAAGLLHVSLFLLPYGYPPLLRLHGANFVNTRLADALFAVAQQRTEQPFLNFSVSNPKMASVRITVEIPEGCTVGKALRDLGQAAGCEFRWERQRVCCDVTHPLEPHFHFYAAGRPEPVPFRRISITRQLNLAGGH